MAGVLFVSLEKPSNRGPVASGPIMHIYIYIHTENQHLSDGLAAPMRHFAYAMAGCKGALKGLLLFGIVVASFRKGFVSGLRDSFRWCGKPEARIWPWLA